MLKTVFVLSVVGAMNDVTGAVLGPGQGPWEQVTPESEGLNSQDLETAASDINSKVSGRQCFLVVKNGKIVHETIYSGSESKTNTGFSTTKSMCSSLFGIATEQGWASPEMKVADKVSNGRRCNPDAAFKNVLTMTGTSPDVANPRYKYDTFGTDCLDTLSGFIQENNPDGASASDWKDANFFKPLGMEHSRWSGSNLACGTSAELSCRDLARAAQLWLNEGEWKGADGEAVQLMSREHAVVGTTQVFPDAGGDPYGYTVRKRPADPVDPNVAYFGGVLVQCAFFSREHNAVVVSMGSDLFSSCESSVWEQARNAIVSSDHPQYEAVAAMAKAQRLANVTLVTAPGKVPQTV